MPRYCLKISKEMHRRIKETAKAHNLSVTKLISGAVLALSDVGDPDRPLIVGSSDTLIGAKTKRLDHTYPKA